MTGSDSSPLQLSKVKGTAKVTFNLVSYCPVSPYIRVTVQDKTRLTFALLGGRGLTVIRSVSNSNV